MLAVGDESFTHKCLDKFSEFAVEQNVLIVTHSLAWSSVCVMTPSGLMGEKQAEGDPKRVIGAYLTAVEQSEQQQMAATTAKAVQTAKPLGPAGDMFQPPKAAGIARVEIVDVQLIGQDGQPYLRSHGDAGVDPVQLKTTTPTSDLCWRQRVQCGRRLLLRHQHRDSKPLTSIASTATARSSLRSIVSTSWKAHTSSTSRFIGATARRTTITGFSTRSASSRDPRVASSARRIADLSPNVKFK